MAALARYDTEELWNELEDLDADIIANIPLDDPNLGIQPRKQYLHLKCTGELTRRTDWYMQTPSAVQSDSESNKGDALVRDLPEDGQGIEGTCGGNAGAEEDTVLEGDAHEDAVDDDEDAMSVDEMESGSGSESSVADNGANTTTSEAMRHQLHGHVKFYEHYVVAGMDAEDMDEHEQTAPPNALANAMLSADEAVPGTQEQAGLKEAVEQALASVLQVTSRVRYSGKQQNECDVERCMHAELRDDELHCSGQCDVPKISAQSYQKELGRFFREGRCQSSLRRAESVSWGTCHIGVVGCVEYQYD